MIERQTKSGTMNVEPILIDTSVWIAYFRDRNARLSAEVDEILSNAEVVVPKIVLAELIQGAKTEREVAVLEDFLGAFTIIDQTKETWIKAGKLSYALKRKGKTVNLTDCYIAVIANENSCRLMTLDEHFREIRKALKLDLLEVP